MWQADPTRLAEEISGHFGLHFEGTSGRNEAGEVRIYLAPVGVHPNDSFRLSIDLGWRSLRATFLPGAFASHLIHSMGTAASFGQVNFSRIVDKCESENAKVHLVVNGKDVSPLDPSSWPETWQILDLSLRKSPLAINTEDHAENERLLTTWVRRFCGLVLSLAPLEEIEGMSEANPEGLPEGGSIQILVNRYERSYANRMACLAAQGLNCLACGFNFEQVYGETGEGFIHVHHVTPVSQLVPGYLVDPTKDLVPLCPNCHGMAHRSSPPLTVEDLKSLMSERSSQGLATGKR
jgi:5-methylcytosine-specific restriction protein A